MCRPGGRSPLRSPACEPSRSQAQPYLRRRSLKSLSPVCPLRRLRLPIDPLRDWLAVVRLVSLSPRRVGLILGVECAEGQVAHPELLLWARGLTDAVLVFSILAVQ